VRTPPRPPPRAGGWGGGGGGGGGPPPPPAPGGGGESLTGANKGTSEECCRGLRWGENLINKDIPSGIL